MMKTKIRIRLYPFMIMVVILIFTYSCEKKESVEIKDADDNVYETVTIDTQVWMAVNLKTTKYIDGTIIPLVTEGAEWAGLSTPAYCWYSNDMNNKNVYGALYNWYAVNTGKLCPNGWHVPSDSEWTTLTTFLGGENLAGGKLKEKGTTHWSSPNTNASDDFGFKALPGGGRSYNGTYNSIGIVSFWWSSTESDYDDHPYFRTALYNEAFVDRTSTVKEVGFSVRCIKN